MQVSGVFPPVMNHVSHRILPQDPTPFVCVSVKSLQSCLTLCDPMDCSPPSSSVHGILQARILEWVAMPFCRGSSPPRDPTCVSCVSCIGRQLLYHLGSPICKLIYKCRNRFLEKWINFWKATRLARGRAGVENSAGLNLMPTSQN